jgi:acetate kinase
VWLTPATNASDPAPVASLADAATAVIEWLTNCGVHGSDLLATLDATAHRIVHGGERFRQSCRLADDDLKALAEIAMLAPLHNPPALAVVEAVRRRLGRDLPLVAVFDTAYYAQLADAAYRYAVPHSWLVEHGVRRYGFHGIAHQFLGRRVAALHDSRNSARVLSLQLGRGCSVTASIGGRAVATSMGFTPLEGLVMGTRAGDIDAGAVLHVLERTGMSAAAMRDVLNQESGLLGLSGATADMRELLRLEAAGEPGAILAVEVFCRRARHYVGAFLAELGGADAVAFGGGIGENCPDIRRRIIGALDWAGIVLDAAANAAPGRTDRAIHAPGSSTGVYVISLDEAEIIATEAAATLR